MIKINKIVKGVYILAILLGFFVFGTCYGYSIANKHIQRVIIDLFDGFTIENVELNFNQTEFQDFLNTTINEQINNLPTTS